MTQCNMQGANRADNDGQTDVWMQKSIHGNWEENVRKEVPSWGDAWCTERVLGGDNQHRPQRDVRDAG